MYNRKYYLKNREKLLDNQKKWQKKNYKGLPKNNKLRIAALKAWRTRRLKKHKEVKHG